MMAKRYEDHPEVIGYDIRNEAPDVVVLGMTSSTSWKGLSPKRKSNTHDGSMYAAIYGVPWIPSI